MAIIYGSQNKLMRVRDINYLMASENLTTTDHTYAELKALKESGQLKPGTSYRMTDFQTIHNIYNTSNQALNVQGVTHVTSAWTGDLSEGVEPLILQAASETEFYVEVSSELYPDDIINYDFNNSVCENGITPRKGLITYRKCTKLTIETYYDWRNWKFRRWAVTAATWTSGTSYAANAVVEYNDYIYQSKIASNTGTPDMSNFDWKPVYQLYHTKSAGHYEGIGIIREHVATSTSNFKIGNVGVGVDPNNFLDYWTFNWVLTGQSGSTYMVYMNGGKDTNYVNPSFRNIKINADGNDKNRKNNIVFVNQTLHFGNKPCSHTISFDNNCANFTMGAFVDTVTYPRNCENNIIKAGHNNCIYKHTFTNNSICSAYWYNFGIGFYSTIVFGMFRSNSFGSAFVVENCVFRGTVQYNSFNSKYYGNDVKNIQNCTINDKVDASSIKGDWNTVTVNAPILSKIITGTHSNKTINLRSASNKIFFQNVDDAGVITATEVL